MKNELIEIISEEYPETIIFDGLDDALIGVSTRDEPRAVYSYQKCVNIFVSQGMSYEEAVEWMDFNVLGTRMENEPIFVDELC